MKRFVASTAAALGAAALIAAAPAGAETGEEQPMVVKNAWARATPASARAGAAFMTLKNTGDKADKVVAADADVSRVVELHTHKKVDGVMKMRQIPDIPVPAGKAVRLQPGGLHIMFIDLKAPLKKGETFPLTLDFARAGEVTVTVHVKAAGAMGGGMDHDGDSGAR